MALVQLAYLGQILGTHQFGNPGAFIVQISPPLPMNVWPAANARPTIAGTSGAILATFSSTLIFVTSLGMLKLMMSKLNYMFIKGKKRYIMEVVYALPNSL